MATTGLLGAHDAAPGQLCPGQDPAAAGGGGGGGGGGTPGPTTGLLGTHYSAPGELAPGQGPASSPAPAASGGIRFVPGCCNCTSCCFSVKVYGCGAYANGLAKGLRGVSVTLTDAATNTVAMSGNTNDLGLVCNAAGAVIRVCPAGNATYDAAFAYADGNASRMVFSIQPPGTTQIVFDGSASCPAGDALFLVAVTPAS